MLVGFIGSEGSIKSLKASSLLLVLKSDNSTQVLLSPALSIDLHSFLISSTIFLESTEKLHR